MAGGDELVAFLGVPADPRLLDADLATLPAAEQWHEPPIATRAHDRLVAAGSLLTGVSLVLGIVLALFGAWRLLFHGGGGLAAAALAAGLLLAGTHWGWVHVAEYAGLTLDDRANAGREERQRAWLAGLQPYPRFSVTTSVLGDASTRVQRLLHQPVLTGNGTFTFVRREDGGTTFDAHASAVEIAETAETMRHRARVETDRLRENWEAASTAYAAALLNDEDDREHLAAQRAAAQALSEHINRSLLEPPVVE